MHRSLRQHALVGLVGVLALAGCEHAENYRWNAESTPDFTPTLKAPPNSRFRAWDKPSVSVYSFATPTPSTGDASLKDLSDRGQAALIEAMTASGAKPEEIRDALAKPLKAKSAPATVAIEGSYKRTLVANVTKGWSAKPGDRLVWTWIYIQPLNFVFDGYSVLATDNQVLNIEQVTNATTANISGTLGQTGSDTSATTTTAPSLTKVLTNVAGNSAGVTGGLSNVYTTTASINQQYMKLGADILPDELRIFRESERNLDVAGNTLIALTMRVDPTTWRELGQEKTHRVAKLELTKDGKFRSATEATLEVVLNKAPPPCPLIADVTLYYQMREVESGRSYVEGEQKAAYRQGEYPIKGVEIVAADDVRKPSWRVYPASPSGQALFVKDMFGQQFPLDFTSYEQAESFAKWLSLHAADFYGKDAPPIGSEGLTLSSGVVGQPLFAGPYVAQRLAAPADIADQCARMNAVRQVAQKP